jgi:hypothetical protein
VPGGPWPHPTRSPEGHLYGNSRRVVEPIQRDGWQASDAYRHGIVLFNAGYYWEAHEEWEALWHAQQRTGPTAWIVQGLIKLAAAGVKARERRPAGVRSHGNGAASLFERAKESWGRFQLGLDLEELIAKARDIAADPPGDESSWGASVARVFSFTLDPQTFPESSV